MVMLPQALGGPIMRSSGDPRKLPQEYLMDDKQASALSKSLNLGAQADAKMPLLKRSLEVADQMRNQRVGQELGSPMYAGADAFANIVGALKGAKTEGQLKKALEQKAKAAEGTTAEALRKTRHGEGVEQYQLAQKDEELQIKRLQAIAALERAKADGKGGLNDYQMAQHRLALLKESDADARLTESFDRFDSLVAPYATGGEKDGQIPAGIQGVYLANDNTVYLTYLSEDELEAGIKHGLQAEGETRDENEIAVSIIHSAREEALANDPEAQQVNAALQDVVNKILSAQSGLDVTTDEHRRVLQSMGINEHSSPETVMKIMQNLSGRTQSRMERIRRAADKPTLDLMRAEAAPTGKKIIYDWESGLSKKDFGFYGKPEGASYGTGRGAGEQARDTLTAVGGQVTPPKIDATSTAEVGQAQNLSTIQQLKSTGMTTVEDGQKAVSSALDSTEKLYDDVKFLGGLGRTAMSNIKLTNPEAAAASVPQGGDELPDVAAPTPKPPGPGFHGFMEGVLSKIREPAQRNKLEQAFRRTAVEYGPMYGNLNIRTPQQFDEYAMHDMTKEEKVEYLNSEKRFLHLGALELYWNRP